jgi:hypothetical protein
VLHAAAHRRVNSASSARVAACCALLVVAVAAAGGHAGAQTSVGCPSPKPLPAGVKKPAAGASATQLAKFMLALPQRKPCDVNLFSSTFRNDRLPKPVPGFYPEGSPMQPATGAAPTEAKVRSQLVAYLKGSAHKAATLAIFDRADVKAKLPDPTLRAAFASLQGTVGEPVIGNFLSRTYVRAPWFCNCLPLPIAIGAATGGGTLIAFNVHYQGEHFALFSGVLAHEILHQAHGTSLPAEEVILNTLTATVHMQVVSRQPELATSGTELSRYLNDWVLMLVNSRTPGSSRTNVVAPGGRGTAPGSKKSRADLWQHASYFHPLGNAADPRDARPAPAVLGAVLRPLVPAGAALPRPLTFGWKTARALSPMNDTWLPPVERLRVSVLLGLVSVEEIVTYTGLSRAKAIATFELAQILAAMK